MTKQNHVRLYTATWLLIVVTGIVGSCAHAQTFDLFKPAAGILKGQTTTYVTTAATSADVISLWTGSCSSTTFLRGDGQCLSPGGAGIGTVTSVGLAWTGSGLTVSNSPVVSAGTLTFSGALNVATGGTGATTLTGLLEGNGTSAIDPAESADVITLWTGTCNSTTFLRADGSCQTIAGNTDASTLTSGTLADARLSSNVPLKNASNTFTGVTQTLSAAAPSLLLNDTAGGTNQKAGRLIHNSNTLRLEACNDAFSTCSNAISVAHSGAGATVDIVNITGTAVNANGNAILTTASTLNGSNVGTGTVADGRLSANVALKNVADQGFSVVGNNSLIVANSSTGFALLRIDTNGLQRASLCTSTSSGVCGSGDAANDTWLRATQAIRLQNDASLSGAATAVFSDAQIDLNATVVNVNGIPVTPTESTFTATGTGFSANPTGTAVYSRHGNVVTLYVPELSGTSTSTSFNITGLPAALNPTRNQTFPVYAVRDNGGVSNQGYLTVQTSGNISLSPSGGISVATVWTNSGTKASGSFTVTYLLN